MTIIKSKIKINTNHMLQAQHLNNIIHEVPYATNNVRQISTYNIQSTTYKVCS